MRTKSEKQWQAESDAGTLTTAQEILADKNRRQRALAEVNRKAELANKVSKKLREVFS